MPPTANECVFASEVAVSGGAAKHGRSELPMVAPRSEVISLPVPAARREGGGLAVLVVFGSLVGQALPTAPAGGNTPPGSAAPRERSPPVELTRRPPPASWM